MTNILYHQGWESWCVVHYVLIGIKFQSDDMSLCCYVSVGLVKGHEWLGGVFIGPVQYSFLRQWHQAASAGLVSLLSRVLHPRSCKLIT